MNIDRYGVASKSNISFEFMEECPRQSTCPKGLVQNKDRGKENRHLLQSPRLGRRGARQRGPDCALPSPLKGQLRDNAYTRALVENSRHSSLEISGHFLVTFIF